MSEADFTYRTTDGLDVHVHAWPVDGPRGIVQIAHGMAEHGARYAPLARALNAAGISVFAQDHRGHGKTLRPGGPPGHLADENGWNRAVADLHGINRAIAHRHPEAPIVVLGHSMGSFMVQQLMYQHPGDMVAAVLSGSNGKPPPIAQAGRPVARAERRRLGGRAVSPLLHRLSFEGFNDRFEPARTEFDWLSRDPEQVDAYVADPLCGFAVTTQTWVDLLDGLDALAQPRNLRRIPRDLPVLLFSGSDDPVGDFGDGVDRLLEGYRSVGLVDLTRTLYPGGRHEMLNEVNRAEVQDDLLRFVERVLAPG